MFLKHIWEFLNKINAPISRFGEKIAGILLCIMTIIVLLQVLFRYLLNSPLNWTDELSCFLMIYMTYLCMPLIYLQDKNISMSFLLEKINGTRISHIILLLIHITALCLFIIWIYFGYLFFLKGDVMANSLPIKMYYIYIAPPILFAITILSVFQKIIYELDQFIHFNQLTNQ
ncbi:C4-dicarboxylate ABC transporter permease [Gallibacterium anatis]|uniref:TRAP transporter small permease protein n=1 Tax=Gallibacterium anatis TaxID=750 RepID=A0A0A2XQ53_9PAST|nr:C4-dicarboxylate ABC transporter permease [Gallibacterium anatis]